MIIRIDRSSILLNLTVFLSAMVSMLLLVIFASLYGPSIEAKVFPVVTNFTVTAATLVQPTELLVSGTLDKRRQHCQFRSLVAYTTPDGGPIKHVAKVEFLGNRDRQVRLLVGGLQTWGPWDINSSIPLKNTTLNITVYHRCHDFYLSTTTLPPIDISELLLRAKNPVLNTLPK